MDAHPENGFGEGRSHSFAGDSIKAGCFASVLSALIGENERLTHCGIQDEIESLNRRRWNSRVAIIYKIALPGVF
jgi:hypothetical protein